MSRTPSRPPRAARPAERHFPIVISNVAPVVDGGRFAPKVVRGQAVRLEADVFKDGHDILRARVRVMAPGDEEWRALPMTYDPARDRWSAEVVPDRLGRWRFTVDAWTDTLANWREKLRKKHEAGQEVRVELLEGAQLLDAAARRVRFGEVRKQLVARAAALRDDGRGDDGRGDERIAMALSHETRELLEQHLAPRDVTSAEAEYPLYVDRERAAFAAWYEFFPRSTSLEPGRHGTFADAERLLPRLASLGFDVLYLPPIHPIGHTFRKGRNNSLAAEPGDVGSPWAIGNEHGGHDAIEPALGTVADFERFVRAANGHGLEVALDFALQCSPDHPWVKEHPDWFVQRPDGTIAYAENPPKKYQDIYPLDFWCEDREGLWSACRDVLLTWVSRGVTTFRVDNPHTKPFAFWEWAIREVQERHPEVVFLAEAFTKPKKLLHLAKLGFTQSYGYFTWKNTAPEIREWMTEFSAPEVLAYHRGNLFANTPDILHEFLVEGGYPAFRLRLLLAGTLGPVYGIYSGYEWGENVPVRRGSEEYLDSEKYQLRWRDWDAGGPLDDDIRLLNTVRRAQPALQRADNLSFHPADNEDLLCFRKAGLGDGDDLLVIANLDPHHAQHGWVTVPLLDMGLGPDEPFVVEDLLTGARYTWRGAVNYVRLDPQRQPAHLFRVTRLAGTGA